MLKRLVKFNSTSSTSYIKCDHRGRWSPSWRCIQPSELPTVAISRRQLRQHHSMRQRLRVGSQMILAGSTSQDSTAWYFLIFSNRTLWWVTVGVDNPLSLKTFLFLRASEGQNRLCSYDNFHTFQFDLQIGLKLCFWSLPQAFDEIMFEYLERYHKVSTKSYLSKMIFLNIIQPWAPKKNIKTHPKCLIGRSLQTNEELPWHGKAMSPQHWMTPFYILHCCFSIQKPKMILLFLHLQKCSFCRRPPIRELNRTQGPSHEISTLKNGTSHLGGLYIALLPKLYLPTYLTYILGPASHLLLPHLACSTTTFTTAATRITSKATFPRRWWNLHLPGYSTHHLEEGK